MSLEDDIYEAFLRRGWIIPTTEREVEIAEATMKEEAEKLSTLSDERSERLGSQ